MLLSLITSLFIRKWRYFNLKRMQYTHKQIYRAKYTFDIIDIIGYKHNSNPLKFIKGN